MRRQLGTWGIVVGLLGTASQARGAAADERPLLVAVEVGPGGGAEASQVRKAIANELHRPILALGESVDVPSAASSSSSADADVLLVDVGRERIVLSLRRPSDEPVARALPAPSDRASRLRAIAWMAGNLARDQVTPFLSATTDQQSFASASVALSAPTAAPVEPPPTPAPSTLLLAGPTAMAAVAGTPASPPLSLSWSVTASGGPAVYVESGFSNQSPWSTLRQDAWQVEALKHRPDGWLWGAAVDLSSGGLGAAAQGGVEKRWGKLNLEGTVGIGLESAPVRSFSTTISSSSSTGTQSQTTMTVSYQSVLYGRAFVTLSREVSRQWDIVLRVGVQSTFVDEVGGPFLTSALGVRFYLP